jgi:hypothetical protein
LIPVDYSFYADTFHGKAAPDEFTRLSVKASAYLDDLTQGRITDGLPDATQTKARLALCELVDTVALNESGGGIASESNDGVSVTYIASKVAATDAQRLYSAARLYLGGTGLLYRGVKQC